MSLSLLLVIGLVAGPIVPQESEVSLVRVHGNATLADAEVIRLAGLSVGQRFDQSVADEAEEKLLASGRFETAEVLVRYRGLSESSDVVLVLLVREKKKASSRFMLGPVFDLSDEYGVTLGARVAVVDLGAEWARLSFPFSLGGKRQAAVEGQLGNARFDLSRNRQVNPHFDLPDNRFTVGGSYRVSRGPVAVDVLARWTDVSFDGLEERFTTVGARVALDTRVDPTIPGDAVYAGVDWRRLFFSDDVRPGVDQFGIDLRGYKRLVGQSLLATQFYWNVANGPLPPYERPFMGGGKTLRGTKPGRFLGDNRALATVELRLPLSKMLSFARSGVHVFYDTGAVYDDGESLRRTRFHHGVGGGMFFRVAIIGVRADVGWDLEGTTRFHIAGSFKF